MIRTLQDRATVSDLPPPDAEVLIEEARRRQRRRRTIIAVVVLLIGGLVVGVVSASGGTAPPSNGDLGARSEGQPSAQAASASHVSHVEIPVISPQSYTTGTLGATGGHVFIGSIFGTSCQLTTVVATTLRVVSNGPASCDDPLLYGEDVMPVESVVPIGSQYGDVRMAVRNPATGSIRLGPIVARYGNFSDGRPEWTYGGGYLWLYDAGTEGFTSKPPRLPVEVLKILGDFGQSPRDRPYASAHTHPACGQRRRAMVRPEQRDRIRCPHPAGHAVCPADLGSPSGGHPAQGPVRQLACGFWACRLGKYLCGRAGRNCYDSDLHKPSVQTASSHKPRQDAKPEQRRRGASRRASGALRAWLRLDCGTPGADRHGRNGRCFLRADHQTRPDQRPVLQGREVQHSRGDRRCEPGLWRCSLPSNRC